MKASELIKKLENMKRRHGDIDCLCSILVNNQYWQCEVVDDVETHEIGMKFIAIRAKNRSIK